MTEKCHFRKDFKRALKHAHSSNIFWVYPRVFQGHWPRNRKQLDHGQTKEPCDRFSSPFRLYIRNGPCLKFLVDLLLSNRFLISENLHVIEYRSFPERRI
ncbi:hypothetical protein TNCV_2280691 [Trichonephila clavipes]|nr:hypothetical protein TNCV_2280691 [Trichonephila clavipes]